MSVETEQRQKRTMNPDLEKLVRLQRLDSEIQKKSRLVKSLPELIQKGSDSLNEARTRLKKFDEELEVDKKARRELEREVDTCKDQIAKAKIKLPNVKTNVEYRAILKEQETFDQKIHELDDKQIEVMERIEKRAPLRKELEAAVKTEEAEFSVVRKEKEAELAVEKSALETLQETRKGVIGGITPSIYSNYEKLLKARDGVGVTLVRDKLCGACNQLIPPQLYYQVRTTEEIYKCPHCSRFMYYEPEEVEQDDKSVEKR